MKTFDETYADHEFKEQLAAARSGWMAQVPRETQPDLEVHGLNGTLLARILSVFSGKAR